MSSPAGLRTVSTPDIERLLAAVRRGKVPLPLTKSALASIQLAPLADKLALLHPLNAAGVIAVLEAVLAERADAAAVRAELVWTGPEGKAGWASSTPKVLRALLDRAERSILVAGYSFDHGKEILAPMHEAMRRCGATVDLFMNIPSAPKKEPDLEAFVHAEVTRFLVEQWPWDPKPNVFHDPRTARSTGRGGEREYASMHAKCVVVDERWSLVGSANFTDRGQTRNIEVGVVLDDASFAQALLKQFRGAVAAGVFVHWLG